MVINTYKPIGKTPLQVVNKLKKTNSELADKKIGYAGRLDPMAEGVLILLVEPETKNRKYYQNLDKVYEFEILIGVETDSLDLLGLIINSELPANVSKTVIKKLSYKLQGGIELKYPAYSSKPVKGKPLFWWARKKRLDEIEIPTKRVEIFNLEFISLKKIGNRKLKDQVIKRLSKVQGDFRQNKIIDCWTSFFNKTNQKHFQLAKFRVHSSSGTYIRSLAKLIGVELETNALAYSIIRTQVGPYNIQDSLKI